MSKNIIKILIVGFVMSMVASVATMAQLRSDSHYFTLSVTGGYSSFLHAIPKSSPCGFVGGGFGLGYEYRKKSFYMSIGLDAMSLNSVTKVNNYESSVEAFDTENELVTYNYRFNEWKDNQYSAYVNMPLIFGYNSKTLYVGAGIKFGMPIWGSTKTYAQYSTAGVYEQYIGEFENIPNHFYSDYESTAAPEDLVLGPNFAAIFEIGGNVWTRKPKKRGDGQIVIKLGAYVEYGCMNILKKTPYRDDFVIDPANVSQITMTPLFNSTASLNQSLTPLYVGIKATFLFEVKKQKRCSCLQTKKGLSWKRYKITK